METPGRGVEGDAPGSQETWSLTERGSFTHGVCRVCDWVGPGRRAPRSAAVDAELHAETVHPSTFAPKVEPTPVAEVPTAVAEVEPPSGAERHHTPVPEEQRAL